MSELTDITEMYLRTVYKLLKGGVPPLRARVAERLHQSNPIASQTVARMERDGPFAAKANRTVKLTPKGARLAHGMMRKHRLVERLFTGVIDLEWEKMYAEVCRREHVISDKVGRRLLGILRSPARSPYGNPIPGLRDLGLDHGYVPFRERVVPSSEAVPNRGEVTVTMERMNENFQANAEAPSALAAPGLRLGVKFVVRRARIDLRSCLDDKAVIVDEAVVKLLFVAPH